MGAKDGPSQLGGFIKGQSSIKHVTKCLGNRRDDLGKSMEERVRMERWLGWPRRPRLDGCLE